MNVHTFRVDDVTHAVLTTSKKMKRNRTRALCGQVFGDSAQRLAPHDVGMNAPITCDNDASGVVAFADLMDRPADFIITTATAGVVK